MNNVLYSIDESHEYEDLEEIHSSVSELDYVANQLNYAVESVTNILNHYQDLKESNTLTMCLESVYAYMPQLREVVSVEDSQEGFIDKVTRLGKAAGRAIIALIREIWRLITGYAKTKEKREEIIKEVSESLANKKDIPNKDKVELSGNYVKTFYYNEAYSHKQWDAFTKDIDNHAKLIPKFKQIIDQSLNVTDRHNASINLLSNYANLDKKAESIDDKHYHDVPTLNKTQMYSILTLIEKYNDYLNAATELEPEIKKYLDTDEPQTTEAINKTLKDNLKYIADTLKDALSRFVAHVNLLKFMLHQYDSK